MTSTDELPIEDQTEYEIVLKLRNPFKDVTDKQFRQWLRWNLNYQLIPNFTKHPLFQWNIPDLKDYNALEPFIIRKVKK